MEGVHSQIVHDGPCTMCNVLIESYTTGCDFQGSPHRVSGKCSTCANVGDMRQCQSEQVREVV